MSKLINKKHAEYLNYQKIWIKLKLLLNSIKNN